MTTNDIPAIRRLANRSTGTPWILIQRKVGDRRILAVIADGHGDEVDYALVAEVPLEPGDDNINDWRNDAEFIAAARQIVPDLCDEVEQLRAELNEALPQITAAWIALDKAGFQSPVAGIAELIDELAAALADAEGRGTALAALLTKSREQAAKVHEKNAAAQNALRSLSQAYADLKTDNDELAAENARVRQQRDELKPVVEAAKRWRDSGGSAEGHISTENALAAAVVALSPPNRWMHQPCGLVTTLPDGDKPTGGWCQNCNNDQGIDSWQAVAS